MQHILAKRTIDTRISSALKKKAKVLEDMFDGEMRLDEEDDATGQSVFEMILNEYLLVEPSMI